MNEPISKKRQTMRQMETVRNSDGCPRPEKTGYLCVCGYFHVGNQPRGMRRDQFESTAS